tara:strand:- start:118 stop:441 length:324 start_codon:yes stop_codon:yes gene_type:complete
MDFSIRPAKKDCLPAMTAFLKASAIRNGFLAFAIAVLAKTPSQPNSIAMELGCDGVLANTAIAKAKKPFLMALAFKNAVIAGRQSFLAGRIEKSIYGSASSPTTGII